MSRMSRKLLLPLMAIVVAVAVVALAPRSADATVVICQRKNKVRLRLDACKGKEVRVDAADLGVTGPAGAPGISGREIVTSQASGVSVGTGETHFLQADCPPGKTVLAGGCVTESGSFVVTRSIPSEDGWYCSFFNRAPYGIVAYFSAQAVCATVEP